jgi:hypothetical protein
MKLDLINGINIQIGGEAGKFNTLPIEVLIKVSESLQKLIQNIAHLELGSSHEIDLSNFKVEFSGFKIGSAIPMFMLTPRIAYTIKDIDDQRKFVNNRFNKLMTIADNGEFNHLKDEYKDGFSRNQIVSSLSDFTNSAGNSPMKFAKFSKTGEIQTVSTIRRIKPKVLKNLLADIKKDELQIEEDYGVAKIKYSTYSDGRRKKKLMDEIRDHDAALSYTTDEIQYMGSVYKLNAHLNCKLEKEDNYYIIENNLLDIVGTGKSIEYAKLSFAEEFDYIYKRYNELKETELTQRTKMARDFINIIVKEIDR